MYLYDGAHMNNSGEGESQRETELSSISTWDHQRRNLIMCQSEFSIQRRSIGNMNKAAASKFGSRYRATATIYRGGMPLNELRNDSTSLNFSEIILKL